MKLKHQLSLYLLAVCAVACQGQPVDYRRSVYLLVDISGTYLAEIHEAERVVRAVLTHLKPGDSFTLAQIDSDSFSEKKVIVNITFNRLSTTANQEKLVVARKVGEFVKKAKSSRYSDITGGILQGVEYLNRTSSGRKFMIVISDLKEELRRDQIRDVAIDFSGIHVISMNVVKLKADARDPRSYYNRLKYWESRVTKTQGLWQVIAADEKEKILDVISRR